MRNENNFENETTPQDLCGTKNTPKIILFLNKTESLVEQNCIILWISNTKKPLRAFMLMLAFVMILFIFGVLFSIPNIVNSGTIFSALQALFSGLAFSGMLAALSLQKQELNDTRKELEFTKKATQEIAETTSKELNMKFAIHKLSTLNTLIEETKKEIDLYILRIEKLKDSGSNNYKNPDIYNNSMDKLKDSYFQLIEKNNEYMTHREKILAQMYHSVIHEDAHKQI